jgi:hypothetical protein
VWPIRVESLLSLELKRADEGTLIATQAVEGNAR